jgi:hypothetical protein
VRVVKNTSAAGWRGAIRALAPISFASPSFDGFAFIGLIVFYYNSQKNAISLRIK